MAEGRLDVLAHTDAVGQGGAEISLGHLLARLPEELSVGLMCVDRGIADWLGTRRPGMRTWIVPPADTKRDVRGIAVQLATVARIRPRVLHANLRAPWACSYAIGAGLVVPGVRVVAVEQLPMPLTDESQRILKRWASRRLSAHVAVGHGSARELEADIGLPHGSIRVIHNGVPNVELTPQPRIAAGPVIGSLGRLHEQKGYDVLVRALEALPDVTCVIVGDGEERERLEQIAREVGVADRLHLLGWTDSARDHLTSFDLFVLPSRYEGFPLSIVEAMQAGLPVVASDVGSIAEALDGERAGLLVQPDDPAGLAEAIRSLLDDEPRRRRLAEHASRLGASRHTADAMTASFVDLYREIGATNSGDRGSAPAPPA